MNLWKRLRTSNMLKEYLLNIISSKSGNVLYADVRRQLLQDAEQCINELCKSGEVIYVGKNINKIPIFKSNKNEN